MLRGFWQKVVKALRSFVSRGLAWEGVREGERFSVGGKLAGSAPDLRKWKLSGRPRAVDERIAWTVWYGKVWFHLPGLTHIPSFNVPGQSTATASDWDRPLKP